MSYYHGERLRQHASMRRLANRHILSKDDLIWPLFLVPGTNQVQPLDTLPGINRYSLDQLEPIISALTIPAVLLFAVYPESDKSADGGVAVIENGLIPRAVERIKSWRPDLAVITDVCLCQATDHGHCGVTNEKQEIDHQQTLDQLAKIACLYGQAGCDMVAPSAMRDGQVQAIRHALDQQGLEQVAIMSYAAKFASAFYGPFRDALKSAPMVGDRQSHQLPGANVQEAMQEIIADDQEGADWLMVKPGLPYLDIIAKANQLTKKPIAAYQVSGEYAMLKAASQLGALKEREAVLESLLSLKRAGASAIITYYAQEVSTWI